MKDRIAVATAVMGIDVAEGLEAPGTGGNELLGFVLRGALSIHAHGFPECGHVANQIGQVAAAGFLITQRAVLHTSLVEDLHDRGNDLHVLEAGHASHVDQGFGFAGNSLLVIDRIAVCSFFRGSQQGIRRVDHRSERGFEYIRQEAFFHQPSHARPARYRRPSPARDTPTCSSGTSCTGTGAWPGPRTARSR